MNSKVNYMLLGLFIIILGFGLIVGILWLSVDKDNKSYHTYQVYMNESVSGLNLNAPVKYKGVEIGVVKSIQLKLEQSASVYLLLDVEQTIPIKQDTYATLSVNSLTGIAFIELAGGSFDVPLVQRQPDQNYPEIASRPSLYQRVDSVINRFFSQQNSEAVTDSLKNIQIITNIIAKNEKNLTDFIQNITQTAYHSAQFSQDLATLSQQISHTLQATENSANTLNQLLQTNQANIQQSAETITQITTELHRLSSNLRNDMDFLGQQAVPEITRSLSEFSQLLATARRLIHTLELQPNVLLFGDTKPSEGPGE